MFSHERRVRTGIDRIFRGVALLFLAFTFVDLASPEVCAEDIFGFPHSALTKAAAAADRAPANEARSSTSSLPSDRDSEPSHTDEDCFCCCSHLVVTAHYSLAGEELTNARYTAQSLRRLASHPPNPFHPPRPV